MNHRVWDPMHKNYFQDTYLNQKGDPFIPGLHSLLLRLNSGKVQMGSGILDSKGTEIFEGDLVSLENCTPKEMLVCWDSGVFFLASLSGEYLADIYYCKKESNKTKIVGNINQKEKSNE